MHAEYAHAHPCLTRTGLQAKDACCHILSLEYNKQHLTVNKWSQSHIPWTTLHHHHFFKFLPNSCPVTFLSAHYCNSGPLPPLDPGCRRTLLPSEWPLTACKLPGCPTDCRKT
uniref:Uncharacterized protein n=1 Tax=Cyclopterus lumpus TaxID=8103 RepID=A0A8C2XME0_CYCLU